MLFTYLFFKWLHISNRLAQVLNNVRTTHANNLFIKHKCIFKQGINFFLQISYTKSVVKWWKCVNMVKVPTEATNVEEILDAKPRLGTETESSLRFRYTFCNRASGSFGHSCFYVSLVICAFTCTWPRLDIAVIAEIWWDDLCEQSF